MNYFDLRNEIGVMMQTLSNSERAIEKYFYVRLDMFLRSLELYYSGQICNLNKKIEQLEKELTFKGVER